MKNLCLVLVLLLTPANIVHASEINYNFAEIGYADGSDNVGLDLIGVMGSAEISDPLFIQVAYGYNYAGIATAEFKAFGLGFVILNDEQMDLTLTTTYITYDFGYPYSGETGSELILSFGARKKLSDNIEWGPNLAYGSDSQNLSASIDGVLSAADTLALTGGLGFSNNGTSYSLGLRLYF